jgi:hypothetical protein
MNTIAQHHFKVAKDSLHQATKQSPEDQAKWLLAAQVHATLALVQVLDGTVDVAISMGTGDPISVTQS